MLFTWIQHEQNYGELASSRLQWIMHTAKMTLTSMVGKYQIQTKMILTSMAGKYQIQTQITLESIFGKYQIQANIYRLGTVRAT